MKTLLATTLLLLLAGCADNDGENHRVDLSLRRDTPMHAAVPTNPLLPVDRSPMDMAYFPVDFPILKTTGKAEGQPLARVIYSRPLRQGRTIFGALVPYGQPWRLGANEATELELFAPATIQGRQVPRGRYILYCIPQKDQWTIVLNTNLYSWGLKPDPEKDAFRFTVPVAQKQEALEHFTMLFAPAGKGAELIIAWDQAEARLPIQFR